MKTKQSIGVHKRCEKALESASLMKQKQLLLVVTKAHTHIHKHCIKP